MMQEMGLVPVFDLPNYPQQPSTNPTPGQVNGVYITLPPDYAAILEKISGWFANRSEVDVIDYGVSDKQGFGYIILEWYEYQIEQLFLDILMQEDFVGDYTVYVRYLED